jgi:Predicted endonuclease distantly related to archaeal Holliday junction resolvase
VKGRNRTREVGRLGEDLAARYLQKQGYTILERNYRCQGGEIDWWPKNGDFLVFVEVRSAALLALEPQKNPLPLGKKPASPGSPVYVAERGWDGFWRIDLLAIELSPKGSVRRINLIKNAVEEG